MRFKFVCVLLGVGCGILGAGCQTGRVSSVEGPQSIHGRTHRNETVIDPKNGYMSNRWIGLRSSSRGKCPGVDGWTGEPLLDRRSARDVTIQELGLDRFCVYTPKAGYNLPFVAPPGLTAARDRLAISSSAPPANVLKGSPLTSHSNEVDGALAQEFLSQTGPLPSPLPGSSNVQIIFVDGQPDGSIPNKPPQGSRHGFTVAHLAQKLVCDGHCVATVAAKRALNFDDPGQTAIPLSGDKGGAIGTITDLGNAIIAAVKERSPRKNLILNLSIGWDGEAPLDRLKTDLGAREVSELETSVQFVYGALQFATQKDVLVIAAAGNRRGGSLKDTNWPTLPAAWELRHPSWSYFDPPLIYAVGGVDWQGLPLPNSRTNGLPVRVAYGDHATVSVKGRHQTSYTTIYTGTSVSTAVVSAAAAMIWHLHPHLRPAEVMELIDSSGETQDARADFYPGHYNLSPPMAPQIQEVSLCAAVKKASAAGSALLCPPLQHQPPRLSEHLWQPDPGSGTSFQPTVFPPFPPSLPPCYQDTVLLTADGNPSQPVCPTDQLSSISAKPWVLPQPGDDPCPNCTLVPTGPPHVAAFAKISSVPPSSKLYSYNLAIALSQSWIGALPQGVSLNPTAMLDIDCFVPGTMKMKRKTYPVQIDYPTSKAWTAFGFAEGESLKGCRAQLNFVVQDAKGTTLMSVQNPVVVDPGSYNATGVAVNPVGSDKSIVAASTNGAAAGETERKRATKPPF